MRGVDLGGWLVIEHWMTSTSPAWNGVPINVANGGEYQAMKHLGMVNHLLFMSILCNIYH